MSGLISASDKPFKLASPGDTLLIDIPTVYAGEKDFSALIKDLQASEELLKNCDSSLLTSDKLVLELDNKIALQQEEILLLEEKAKIYKRQTTVYRWFAILAGAIFLSDKLEID